MPKKTMVGLAEQLDDAGINNKKIVELQMDFTLPPPIYAYHITVKPEKTQRTIKLVKEINRHRDGIEVVSVEGNRYVVSGASIKYYVEE